MPKFLHPKRLAQFTIKNVILFTLACLLTIIPSTFANQPDYQTIKISVTQTQQLLEQGETLYQAGRFTETITVLQQAVRIYQQENNNLGQAAALTNLSLVYQQIGAWKEADEAVDSSLKLLSWNNSTQKINVNHPKSDLEEILAQTLDIKARLLLTKGKPDLSVQISQQAEQIWKKLGNNAKVTRNRIDQAQALRVSGFYSRSLDILNEISQQLQTQPDSPIKVTALRGFGNTQQQLGNLEASQRILHDSLEIAQRLQIPEEIALTQLSLGNTARSLGKIEDAINYYQNAAKVTSNSLTSIQAQINQLSLLVEKGQITAAKILIPTIQSQLVNLPINQGGIYARINFARTLTTAKIGNQKEIAQILATSVQQAKTISDERAESYALGSLGAVYEQNRQWTQARNLTQKAIFIAQKNNASDIAYLWEWQLGRLLKVEDNIEAAVAAYDASIETLQSLRTDLATVNREIQFNFRDRVEPIYRQSVELLLQQKGEAKPDLDKVRRRIEALQLAELDNYFREACLNNQFVVLDEVVDRNNPDTAIFYPIILDNQLEVILKLPNQKKLIHKTNRVNSEKVEQIITQMRVQITQPDGSQQFKLASQQLYEWLIKPVETELQNSQVKTLIFIPDGSLRNIPMSALSDGQEYLVQKYAIAISPGLQLFEPKSLTRQKLNALIGGLSTIPKGENFAPLPNVQQELASIQESGISTVTLYNERFRSNILEEKINAQPFQVVHFATHGQFSSNPNETFILASDKRIKVAELDKLLKSRGQKLTEPIELLVLSACQTATGDNRAALGLAGVALRAGARSTLASLWQIGDDSTADFINGFYHELTTGKKTTAEALREAQLKLLKSNEYSRPRYWAAYVLVGNWL
ncbi:CHAT domain-containing protein [Rivularia sp. UHCC 0363]|uniref:CHAT domain-containing protein n=1 Tax=Rivularia sp. UHCC 0363 TaxID=3110244 RepID=UPI002B208442|nr:CHAT domain-containing protein [Rivularia sp. UHCC 0363]MEA5598406.1 CHAT domain-containing protein [Rivularia sp. UHCC 0363]